MFLKEILAHFDALHFTISSEFLIRQLEYISIVIAIEKNMAQIKALATATMVLLYSPIQYRNPLHVLLFHICLIYKGNVLAPESKSAGTGTDMVNTPLANDQWRSRAYGSKTLMTSQVTCQL